MKTLDIGKATDSLARYAKNMRKGPVIVTSRGRPIAALVPVKRSNRQSAELGEHPRLLEIIEQSWAEYLDGEGIPLADVRRRLGIRKSA